MDVSRFQEKLGGICALAGENGGKLTGVQVREFFGDMELDKAQLLKVLQYLKAQEITIEGVGPEADAASSQGTKQERVPLTSEEEAYLKEYQAGLLPGGDGRTQEELFEALAKGEESAAASLALRYLPVAARMAVERNCPEIHLSDLIQEANVSLLAALKEPGAEPGDAWLLEKIRCGIQRAVEEQTQRKFEDNALVAKVQNLEAAVKELSDEEEDGESKFSVEELAVIMDMDVEEIRGVLRLTGDDK